MTDWYVIAVAGIRLSVLVLPLFDLLARDYEQFPFRGLTLKEAKEMGRATNAKMMLLSWPFYLLASLFTKMEEHSLGIAPAIAFVIVVASATWLWILRVPIRHFRGYVPPVVIGIVVTTLDVLAARLITPGLLSLLAVRK